MRIVGYVLIAFGIIALFYSFLFLNTVTGGFIDYSLFGLQDAARMEKELITDFTGLALVLTGLFLLFLAGSPVRCPFCQTKLHKKHGHCPNCAKNIFISPHGKSVTIEASIPSYYWEPETYYFRLHGELFINPAQVEALVLKLVISNPKLHPVSALNKYYSEIVELESRLPGFLKSAFRDNLKEQEKKLIDRME